MYYEGSYLMDDRTYKDNCSNSTFVDPLTGIIRGNLSKDEFLTYKKYVPMAPKLKNDRAIKLFELQKYDFALHELKLYLDNFPNDKNKLDLFNKYNKKSETMIKEYNMRYEPITLTGNDFKDIPFAWVDSPWPWEGV